MAQWFHQGPAIFLIAVVAILFLSSIAVNNDFSSVLSYLAVRPIIPVDKLCPKDVLLDGTAPTAKGTKTFRHLLEAVYEPFGFQYEEVEGRNCTATSILFPLKYKVSMKCFSVFRSSLDVQDKSNITVNTTDPPPQFISDAEKDLYLLNGYSWLSNNYINEIPANLPKTQFRPWTPALIEEYTVLFTNSNWDSLPYRAEAAGVFHALKHFKPTGQTGIVIGSQNPWVEAMALYHGAAKVITAEYAPLIIQHPALEYVHPSELMKNWKKYRNMDFVVSFSSIEHSGLGRYGDPPDPIGDFREIRKMHCLLKEGGLLYLGLPYGQDTIEYNAHRIYGFIRWPMIAAGFEFLGTIYGTNGIVDMRPHPNYAPGVSYEQYVFILRKK